MSLAIVHSRALVGLTAPPVRVEVHLGNGLPAFHLVGLPQAAVRESADRVRAALLHAGFEFPSRRLTVNLAPADLPKDTGRFDLPIALGVLAVSGQIPPEALEALEFVGELSLTGELRPIRGALAMVMALAADGGRRRLVLPEACRAEAALVHDVNALSADTLQAVCAHLRGEAALARVDPDAPAPGARQHPDLREVRGQTVAKRALQIAAAGAHPLLMVGPPGSGKTLLAGCLAGLLPPMPAEQAVACALIESVSGRFDPAQWAVRPLRAPHHSASVAALVGGGNPPRPGEITRAHHGLLFLDELPEFPRAALESLREPLETGQVTLSRAARQATYPARFLLVAAMNPCPCGYLGSRQRACTCPPGAAQRYRQKLSGPLLDRIDLQIDVPAVDAASLLVAPVATDDSDTSAAAARRVAQAQDRALQRQGRLNGALDPAGIDAHCALGGSAQALLLEAARRFRWSARALHRVLRVARTIADLAGHASVQAADVAEAVQQRRSAILSLADTGATADDGAGVGAATAPAR